MFPACLRAMAHHKLSSIDTEVTAFVQDSPTESLSPEILSTPSTASLAADPRYDNPPPTGREGTVNPSPYPPVIPPPEDTGPGRTLVLCFDGTGDQFNADNSNIVQLVSLLKKGDSTKQLVYYQVRSLLSNFWIYFRTNV